MLYLGRIHSVDPMKKVFAVLAAACLFLGFCRTPLAAQTRKAFPEDNGKALVNPGMGWMLYYYSNILDTYGSRLEPSDVVADFPGMSTVFLRLPWSFLEPEKDRFNWEIIAQSVVIIVIIVCLIQIINNLLVRFLLWRCLCQRS